MFLIWRKTASQIKKDLTESAKSLIYLERETRFELATSTLARLHSTTELFPQNPHLMWPCERGNL